MDDLLKYYKGHSSAAARWARFGPYYAMFPIDFAFNVVNKYSKPGDKILDPFSGRGSSIFAGSVLGRESTGIEINPLGWLYSNVKLHPARVSNVLTRLKEIYDLRENYVLEILNYNDFFRMCYCDEVLKFLLSARENLDWKNNNADRTLMAFIAIYLHAAIGEGLSNQMRLTKSLGMQYSIDWWKKNNLTNPPEINPYEVIKEKIEWRYKYGVPERFNSSVKFGDSCKVTEKMLQKEDNQYSLLFTSPPYCGITDYFMDQWLRLWLLGGSAEPEYQKDDHKGRFGNKDKYKELLNTVFGNCSSLMKDDAVIYVRTDSREFTLNTTIDVLKDKFPNHEMEIHNKPIEGNTKTQTVLYGNTSKKPGETDIILKRAKN